MRHYTFIDYATQGYIALVAMIILALHGHSVPGWGWLVGAHLLCLALVHGLIRASAARPANRVLDFLRHFYPVLLYTGFYRETGMLNQVLFTGYFDGFLFRAEHHLFGCQPSLRFMLELPQRWVAELLYFSYFSYYLMIGGVGVALFVRNRAQFYHYVSVVSFVFYACYLFYIFVPVIGPRIGQRDMVPMELPPEVPPMSEWVVPPSVESGVFYRIMVFIYHNFETPGAAFPSSHVAIALATVYFSFHYLRAIRWPHLLLALLLCCSTVYGRYHYVVDVFAGALTTAALLPLGEWLYRKFGGGPHPQPDPERAAALRPLPSPED
jgi:membrane-associated phospholipid phosphatase